MTLLTLELPRVVAFLALVYSLDARAENMPAVVGAVDPTPRVVFDPLHNGCGAEDFPDSIARAFRDADGTVHLLATHHVNRAKRGPSLREVSHDCAIVFRGRHDPRPEAYDDYGWLAATHTLDGRTIFALVHNEFHGNERPALCPSRVYIRCWENAITWAVSRDGGRSFIRPPGPSALVAALPYRYGGERERPFGLFNPTNIVAHNSFFFVMLTVIDPVRGDWGACLMRTHDLADPTSWRAWDGTDFTIRTANPYAEPPPTDPAAHRCRAVGSGRLLASLGSLSWMQDAGVFVLTMRFQRWDRVRQGEVPGAYIATSTNLTDWSQPSLLLADGEAGTPGVVQLYPALLDPDAPDRNFQTISSNPLLFTVEAERGRPVRERKLVARQVTLRVSR